jgi:predicted DNA-binding transcriptional regulator AlpA
VTVNTSYMPDAATSQKLAVREALTRFGSKKDVAAMLQLSVRSVDNLVAAGCPVMRIGKRRCRFDLPEVAAWVKERYGQQRRRAKTISQGQETQ